MKFFPFSLQCAAATFCSKLALSDFTANMMILKVKIEPWDKLVTMDRSTTFFMKNRGGRWMIRT
jgi:hypothetical protein